MIQKVKHIILFLMCFIAVNAKANGIQFSKMSYDEARLLSLETNKPIFIDFYTQWCGPCKVMSNDIFTQGNLGQYINENFIAIQLDAEESINKDVIRAFSVVAYPTMIFQDVQLDVDQRLSGVQAVAKIISAGDLVLNPDQQKLFQLRKLYEVGKRDADFILDYINELELNLKPFTHIAKDFVESNHFEFLNVVHLEILRMAELKEKHEKMLLFLMSYEGSSEKENEIFIELAQRKYDEAFRRRNVGVIEKFAEQHILKFEMLTGVKMDSQDIINYLGTLHRIRID